MAMSTVFLSPGLAPTVCSPELEALVVGQIELGTDLHVKLVDEIALVGNIERGGINVGRAQGSHIEVVGQLLQAGEQKLGADLLVDFLLEFADDDAARRLAGA